MRVILLTLGLSVCLSVLLLSCGMPDGQNAQACEDAGTPRFTHAVTDLAAISHIVPLGEVQTQHDFTPHTYIVNADTSPVPVYAPVDIEVYNVVDNGGDYVVQARVTCDVYVEFAHITSPRPELVAKAQSTYHGMDPAAPAIVTYAAGDQLGTTTGTAVANTWDFGVWDRSRSNPLLNSDRAGGTDKVLYSMCPYSFYDAPLRDNHVAVFGPKPIATGATCRSVERGVAGTIAGAWWKDSSDVFENVGEPAVSPVVVASSLNGHVRLIVGDDPVEITSGPLPELTAGEQCYDLSAGYAYFKLVSDTAIDFVYEPTGSCPTVFPTASAERYWR